MINDPDSNLQVGDELVADECFSLVDALGVKHKIFNGDKAIIQSFSLIKNQTNQLETRFLILLHHVVPITLSSSAISSFSIFRSTISLLSGSINTNNGSVIDKSLDSAILTSVEGHKQRYEIDLDWEDYDYHGNNN